MRKETIKSMLKLCFALDYEDSVTETLQLMLGEFEHRRRDFIFAFDMSEPMSQYIHIVKQSLLSVI